jgi:hypothetical protein
MQESGRFCEAAQGEQAWTRLNGRGAMRKPFLRWDNGWPILTCPEDGSEMGWLGGAFWLCYKCKLHRIKVGIMGRILR